MKKVINHGLIILILVSLNFSSCKKTDRMPAVTANTMPVANAGVDQTVYLPINYTFLDGEGSSDRDNNITGCLWKLVSGPSTNISKTTPNELRTRITTLVKRNYVFELTVADNVGPNSRDTMQVSVIKPNYSNSEIIFKNQSWRNSWYKKIDFYYFSSYLPANSHIKNIYIKRSPLTETEWKLVFPNAQPDPGSYYTFTYSPLDDLMIIYSPNGEKEMINLVTKSNTKYNS